MHGEDLAGLAVPPGTPRPGRRSRCWLLAASAGVAGLIALPAAAGPAIAATSAPGWHITKVFGASYQYPNYEGLSASGPDDGWLVGETAPDALSVEHWTGESWVAVTPPAKFEEIGVGVSDSVVGSASAADMWTFPTAPGGQYALHRTSTGWHGYRLRGVGAIFGTAVFSDSDAWAFGQSTARQSGLGDSPPYVARFDGHSWKRASMPGVPVNVSALAAHDIWAFGPTTRTAADGRAGQDVVAMHWTGHRWYTRQIPRAAGDFVIAAAATAVHSLWAVEEPVGPPIGTESSAGPMRIFHWNGSRWKDVVTDAADVYQGALASDGHGGIWVQAMSARTHKADLVHFSSGHLTRSAVPGKRGYTAEGGGLSLIPGTRSLFADVGLNPDAIGKASETAVARYTP